MEPKKIVSSSAWALTQVKMEALSKSLSGWKETIPSEITKFTKLSRPIKLTALSVSVGLALIGALAMFFRRRKRRAQMIQKKLEAKKQQRQQLKNHSHHSRHTAHHLHQSHNMNSAASTGNRSSGSSHKRLPRSMFTMTNAQSPNGDTPRRPGSNSVDGPLLGNSDVAEMLRLREMSLSLNSLGGISNGSTSSTITRSGLDVNAMSSADLCQYGMEKLSVAISIWEEAMMKLSYLDEHSDVLAIPDCDTANLQHRLENLLDLAYKMQDNYDRLCERQVENIALESALSVFQGADRDKSFDDDSSDQDSFVSATDMANLTDLESNRDILHNVPLYEAGLLELKYGNVPCRTIRPDMVQCLSDVEFLAKLHGIRLAFQHMFEDDDNRLWFINMGRQLVGDLLAKADKDAEEFFLCYDKMVQFVDVPANWIKIEEELRGRGVRVMGFYDIVLDFIIMDAFEDLAHPPSTIMSVIQNRWLSNGFKETALATAVWSVLKAKRSLLKFNDGFIAHFYSMSEHTSPLLAWGFLGPDSDLKNLCNAFKDMIVGFIQDIFSFDKVRFATVETLAEDILALAKEKSKSASDVLNMSISSQPLESF